VDLTHKGKNSDPSSERGGAISVSDNGSDPTPQSRSSLADAIDFMQL
jgi:hypothetical protein